MDFSSYSEAKVQLKVLLKLGLNGMTAYVTVFKFLAGSGVKQSKAGLSCVKWSVAGPSRQG